MRTKTCDTNFNFQALGTPPSKGDFGNHTEWLIKGWSGKWHFSRMRSKSKDTKIWNSLVRLENYKQFSYPWTIFVSATLSIQLGHFIQRNKMVFV